MQGVFCSQRAKAALALVVRRGTLGFSVLRFRQFFRSVFRFFVPKDFGYSVLVFVSVCGFFVF